MQTNIRANPRSRAESTGLDAVEPELEPAQDDHEPAESDVGDHIAQEAVFERPVHLPEHEEGPGARQGESGLSLPTGIESLRDTGGIDHSTMGRPLRAPASELRLDAEGE